jgi:hypothetical protein
MRPMRSGILGAAILAFVAACSGSGASPAPSPSATGGAPLGTWKVTITEADFERAGLTNPGANDENAGTFTFTINADGTFTETQQADHPVKWPVFRGEWTAQGTDQLQLRTTFPADFVGETIVITWETASDGLHLRLVSPDEPYLRAHFETHPWSPAP